MGARIAVIGWGSLLWDLDDLAPKVTGDWARGAGPTLPLEFSRISPKRLMSLVLIVDRVHGAPFATHAIRSVRSALAEAASDLAARERAPIGRIGAATPAGAVRASDPGIGATVAGWCADQGWDGAVWTDLPANFEAETGAPFDVAAGLAYLRTLSGAGLREAKRYIDSAPAEIRTPLRRRLDADPWWAGLESA